MDCGILVLVYYTEQKPNVVETVQLVPAGVMYMYTLYIHKKLYWKKRKKERI